MSPNRNPATWDRGASEDVRAAKPNTPEDKALPVTAQAAPAARVVAFPNSLADLAARIRAEHEGVAAAIRRGLEHAIRAGDLLIEAKGKVPHGEWLPWLATTGVPERAAQRYMRLARNRAKIETANPSDLSDLTVDAALALLANPVNKRGGPPGLNAVGKPYSASYDPNYRIRTPLTSIARLSKPQICFPWVNQIADFKKMIADRLETAHAAVPASDGHDRVAAAAIDPIQEMVEERTRRQLATEVVALRDKLEGLGVTEADSEPPRAQTVARAALWNRRLDHLAHRTCLLLDLGVWQSQFPDWEELTVEPRVLARVQQAADAWTAAVERLLNRQARLATPMAEAAE